MRLKAGHMLTFDGLVNQTGIAERSIMKRVAKRTHVRNTGCLSLPLTVLSFVFYVTSVRFHEELEPVMLLESEVMGQMDTLFQGVESINDIWTALMAVPDTPRTPSFLGYFFDQTNSSGLPLAKVDPQNRWGMWGRVKTYNQLQGAVLFEQARVNPNAFGRPYASCQSNITCGLCKTKRGFVSVANDAVETPPNITTCGNWTWAGRKLQEEVPAGGDGQEARKARAAGGRRLRPFMPYLNYGDGSGPDTVRFRMWLYPSELQSETLERLNYFQTRQWLDKDTKMLKMTVYMLNSDSGKRDRLEQLTVTFHFLPGGGILYEREMQAIFLTTFPDITTQVVDILWLVTLCISTIYRAFLMWNAFTKRALFEHFMEIYTIWEWLITVFGWVTVQGFVSMQTICNELDADLKEVRKYGWDITMDSQDSINQLFDDGASAAETYRLIRTLFSMYSMALMFRFFVSFGAQPALAVVTNTLKAVMNDVLHFLVVFTPTFVAYVISGILVFGRRIQYFCNLQASIGTVFRISQISTYDWAAMKYDYFWTTGIWIWSFMLLLVMLMLNMVIAIIIDVYNEVRTSQSNKEAIWDTAAQFWVRLVNVKSWVHEPVLEKFMSKSATVMVRKVDLEDEFPLMPEYQKELLFKECRAEMSYEAEKDLQKGGLVKLTGSLMQAANQVNTTLRTINHEESADPLRTWIQPNVAQTSDTFAEMGRTFLTAPASAKGGKGPTVKEGSAVKVDQMALNRAPDWLKEVQMMLISQRKVLDFANWQLQQMQWQIQSASIQKLQADRELTDEHYAL